MARRFPRPVLSLSLILVLSAAARADGPAWPVPFGPSRTPAPVRYDPGAWKTVPAEYLDDAAACVLYSGTVERLDPDGAVESTTQELIRLNGRKGIDQFGEYRTITYNPAHERVTLHAARVHKAKGGTVEVEPRHVQLRDVNTDHQIYDPSKQLVVSFPSLEVGDVIEVHWTTRGRNPEFQGQFFSRYTFGHDKYPVVRDEWCVRVPKDRDLKHATVNGTVPLAESAEGDERVFRWAATNCPPLPQGDRLPSPEEFRVQAACSTFGSWDAVSRWDQNLIADRCACTPDVQTVVADVTRGLTDPADKARALAQWVRRHVRYVSAGEKHDYTPHPPARVLANRAGDCKDTALLYTVMARAAGLRAAVATLGMRGDGQVLEAVPSPWGTHALAVVTIDGRDHWVDLTANLIGWDTLPRDDRDRVCHVAFEDGIRVARTPAAAADDNRTEQATTVTVSPGGSASAERVSRYQGTAAWNKRDDFVDTPKTERRRIVTAELLDAYAKVKLRDLVFDDSLPDCDRPLTVRATFDLPDLFTGETTREAPLGDQNLWNLLLSLNVDPERTAAIDLGEPFESVQRFVVRVAPTHVFASVPPTQAIVSAWGTFDSSAKQPDDKPHELELEFRTRLTKTRVDPKDFKAFETFQDSVQAAYRAKIAIKPTADLADAPAIEESLAKSPGDRAAATVLADLYLKHDRHNDAVRVLADARRRHPAERAVWELSLAAADGREDRGELLREMADQFPDDAEVKLDLGANLIDQAKHDEAARVLEPLANTGSAAVQRQALVLLATSAFVQEDPKHALKHLRAAEKADAAGFDAGAWRLKGEVHEALNQPRQALQAFTKALDADPDDEDYVELLLAAVRVATATGARTEALKFLTLYRAQVADDAEGLCRAADAAVRLGRFDDAADLLDQARAPGGGITPAGERPSGLVLAHRGDYAGAVAHLERAEPDADVLAALLHAQLALGHLDEAVAAARRMSQVERPTADVKRTAAQVEALTLRRDELRRALRGDAGPAAAAVSNFVCAEYFHAGGREPERVTALLDQCLAGGAPLGPAYGLRAVLHLDRGRIAKALGDAERAISLGPEDAHGYHARGRARLERGAAGALADLERAAQLSRRQDGVILHHLAAALRQAGRKDEALRTQQAALQLRPGDPELAAQLKEFESK
jgi:tetratricopeptide (TPR) repeat protein/transglutaminase-like putative cysteine protease